MANVRSFAGKTPRVGEDSFVAETAVLVGDVEVGRRSSVWYGVVMRGDVYYIRIGNEVSVQDNAVVHVTSGRHPTLVGNRVTIGHSVVLHGCTVEDECIIGMGAVILDRARVARHCIVGAGALVTPDSDFPEGHLIIGSPARPKRELTSEEMVWIQSSADHYAALAARYLAGG
jgi:carbonic anhydrase/acetyltransferase-like protein (isoleucine patch superfamily)